MSCRSSTAMCSAEVRRIHRGVLDGLSHAEIAARYKPEGGEPELVTRLQDGTEITLSRRAHARRRAAGARRARSRGLRRDPAALHRHVRRPRMQKGVAGRARPHHPGDGRRARRAAAARGHRADRLADRFGERQMAAALPPADFRRRLALCRERGCGARCREAVKGAAAPTRSCWTASALPSATARPCCRSACRSSCRTRSPPRRSPNCLAVEWHNRWSAAESPTVDPRGLTRGSHVVGLVDRRGDQARPLSGVGGSDCE